MTAISPRRLTAVGGRVFADTAAAAVEMTLLPRPPTDPAGENPEPPHIAVGRGPRGLPPRSFG